MERPVRVAALNNNMNEKVPSLFLACMDYYAGFVITVAYRLVFGEVQS